MVIEPLEVQDTASVERVLQLVGDCLGLQRRQHALEGMYSGAVHFVVARDTGCIVACAAYGFCQFHYDTWWIGFCAVDPQYRGRGISRLLVDYRLSKIRESGARWVMAASLEPVDRVTRRGFKLIHDADPHQFAIYDLHPTS